MDSILPQIGCRENRPTTKITSKDAGGVAESDEQRDGGIRSRLAHLVAIKG